MAIKRFKIKGIAWSKAGSVEPVRTLEGMIDLTTGRGLSGEVYVRNTYRAKHVGRVLRKLVPELSRPPFKVFVGTGKGLDELIARKQRALEIAGKATQNGG